MSRISASVGQGGVNSFQDVKIVQTLLNQAGTRMPGFQPLTVDGRIGPKTIGAIKKFQQSTVGFAMPDGRVDPNGRTHQQLVQSGGGSVPSPTPPLVKPPSAGGLITLSVAHGGQVPTNTNGSTATSSLMYESTFTLSGSLTGTFQGSIYPDDMNVAGRVKDGTYPLHIGFHRGGGGAKQTQLKALTQGVRPGLLVNCRSSVPVTSNNASKTTAVGINVHNGFNSSRGSEGCLTLKPSDWTSFINLFLNKYTDIDDWHAVATNSGKKIGSLVIRS